MLFRSQLTIHSDLLPEFSEQAIKDEPMFFNATADFAWKAGGPITRAFLDRLPWSFADASPVILDSRVHMLMPGWYPCIPGWHHDDVPRNTLDGQPNYTDPPYRSRHVLALINAGLAPTQFLVGDVHVPEPSLRCRGQAIYEYWDNALGEPVQGFSGPTLKDRCNLSVIDAPDRALVAFDCDTFHRGVSATGVGWRWFGRVSTGTTRKATNEIRRQVQVYMPTLNAGW